MREEQEFQARKRARAIQEQLANMQLQKAQADLNAPQMPFIGDSIEAQKLNALAQFEAQQNPNLSIDEIRRRAIDRQHMSSPKYTQVVDPYDPNKISYVPLPQQSLFDMPPRQAMSVPMGSQPSRAPIQTAGPGGFSPQPIDPLQANEAAAAARAAELGMPDLPNTTMPAQTDFARMMQGETIGGVSLPNIDPRAMTAPPTQLDAAQGVNQANINLQEYAARKNIDLNMLDAEQQKQLDFERRLLNLKNEAALSKEQKEKIPARRQFDKVLGETIQIIEDLKKGGGMPAGDQSLGENFLAYLASTEGGEGALFPRGQDFQRMINTPNQRLRDRISGREPRLFNAIKKSSGLTGTELNSAFEIQNQLKQLGNDTMSYEARIDLLSSLSSQFGTGKYENYLDKKQRQSSQSRQSESFTRIPNEVELLIERYSN